MLSREELESRVHGKIDGETKIASSSRMFAGMTPRAREHSKDLLRSLVSDGRLFHWSRNNEEGWSPVLVLPKQARAAELAGWILDGPRPTEVELRRLLMSLEPFAMVDFVEDILRSNPARFSNVLWSGEAPAYDLSAYDADVAKLRLFEVKRVPVAFEAHVARFIEAIVTQTGNVEPRPVPTLVIAGVADNPALTLARLSGVDIWDSSTLLKLAHPIGFALFDAAERRIAARRSPTNMAESLAASLKSIEPGKKMWARYQKTVFNLSQLLFVPPLEVPQYELPNEARSDRRDIVLANHALRGMWKALRQLYRADYVVIDAKNSVKIGKREVISIAAYLKPYGAGMFGIVSCRDQVARAAYLAIREQWIGGQKMIVPVTDKDWRDMIDLKLKGASPESIVVEKIRDFRLSL